MLLHPCIYIYVFLLNTLQTLLVFSDYYTRKKWTLDGKIMLVIMLYPHFDGGKQWLKQNYHRINQFLYSEMFIEERVYNKRAAKLWAAFSQIYNQVVQVQSLKHGEELLKQEQQKKSAKKKKKKKKTAVKEKEQQKHRMECFQMWNKTCQNPSYDYLEYIIVDTDLDCHNMEHIVYEYKSALSHNIEKKQTSPSIEQCNEKADIPDKDAVGSPNKQEVCSSGKVQFDCPCMEVVGCPIEQELGSTSNQDVESPGREVVDSPGYVEVNSPGTVEVDCPSKQEIGSPSKQQMEIPSKQEVSSPSKQEVCNPGNVEVDCSCKEEVDCHNQQKLGSPSKQEVGSTSKVEVEHYSKQEIGSSNKQDMGSPRKQEMDCPNMQEMESSSKQEMGSPRKQKLGSSSKQEVGSTSKVEVEHYSKQEIGSSSKQEMGSPRKQEMDCPNMQEMGSSSKPEMGSPMKQKMGSPSKQKVGCPGKVEVDSNDEVESTCKEERKKNLMHETHANYDIDNCQAVNELTKLFSRLHVDSDCTVYVDICKDEVLETSSWLQEDISKCKLYSVVHSTAEKNSVQSKENYIGNDNPEVNPNADISDTATKVKLASVSPVETGKHSPPLEVKTRVTNSRKISSLIRCYSDMHEFVSNAEKNNSMFKYTKLHLDLAMESLKKYGAVEIKLKDTVKLDELPTLFVEQGWFVKDSFPIDPNLLVNNLKGIKSKKKMLKVWLNNFTGFNMVSTKEHLPSHVNIMFSSILHVVLPKMTVSLLKHGLLPSYRKMVNASKQKKGQKMEALETYGMVPFNCYALGNTAIQIAMSRFQQYDLLTLKEFKTQSSPGEVTSEKMAVTNVNDILETYILCPVDIEGIATLIIPMKTLHHSGDGHFLKIRTWYVEDNKEDGEENRVDSIDEQLTIKGKCEKCTRTEESKAGVEEDEEGWTQVIRGKGSRNDNKVEKGKKKKKQANVKTKRCVTNNSTEKTTKVTKKQENESEQTNEIGTNVVAKQTAEVAEIDQGHSERVERILEENLDECVTTGVKEWNEQIEVCAVSCTNSEVNGQTPTHSYQIEEQCAASSTENEICTNDKELVGVPVITRGKETLTNDDELDNGLACIRNNELYTNGNDSGWDLDTTNAVEAWYMHMNDEDVESSLDEIEINLDARSDHSCENSVGTCDTLKRMQDNHITASEHEHYVKVSNTMHNSAEESEPVPLQCKAKHRSYLDRNMLQHECAQSRSMPIEKPTIGEDKIAQIESQYYVPGGQMLNSETGTMTSMSWLVKGTFTESKICAQLRTDSYSPQPQKMNTISAYQSEIPEQLCEYTKSNFQYKEHISFLDDPSNVDDIQDHGRLQPEEKGSDLFNRSECKPQAPAKSPIKRATVSVARYMQKVNGNPQPKTWATAFSWDEHTKHRFLYEEPLSFLDDPSTVNNPQHHSGLEAEKGNCSLSKLDSKNQSPVKSPVKRVTVSVTTSMEQDESDSNISDYTDSSQSQVHNFMGQSDAESIPAEDADTPWINIENPDNSQDNVKGSELDSNPNTSAHAILSQFGDESSFSFLNTSYLDSNVLECVDNQNSSFGNRIDIPPLTDNQLPSGITFGFFSPVTSTSSSVFVPEATKQPEPPSDKAIQDNTSWSGFHTYTRELVYESKHQVEPISKEAIQDETSSDGSYHYTDDLEKDEEEVYVEEQLDLLGDSLEGCAPYKDYLNNKDVFVSEKITRCMTEYPLIPEKTENDVLSLDDSQGFANQLFNISDISLHSLSETEFSFLSTGSDNKPSDDYLSPIPFIKQKWIGTGFLDSERDRFTDVLEKQWEHMAGRDSYTGLIGDRGDNNKRSISPIVFPLYGHMGDSGYNTSVSRSCSIDESKALQWLPTALFDSNFSSCENSFCNSRRNDSFLDAPKESVDYTRKGGSILTKLIHSKIENIHKNQSEYTSVPSDKPLSDCMKAQTTTAQQNPSCVETSNDQNNKNHDVSNSVKRVMSNCSESIARAQPKGIIKQVKNIKDVTPISEDKRNNSLGERIPESPLDAGVPINGERGIQNMESTDKDVDEGRNGNQAMVKTLRCQGDENDKEIDSNQKNGGEMVTVKSSQKAVCDLAQSEFSVNTESTGMNQIALPKDATHIPESSQLQSDDVAVDENCELASNELELPQITAPNGIECIKLTVTPLKRKRPKGGDTLIQSKETIYIPVSEHSNAWQSDIDRWLSSSDLIRSNNLIFSLDKTFKLG